MDFEEHCSLVLNQNLHLGSLLNFRKKGSICISRGKFRNERQHLLVTEAFLAEKNDHRTCPPWVVPNVAYAPSWSSSSHIQEAGSELGLTYFLTALFPQISKSRELVASGSKNQDVKIVPGLLRMI